MLIRPKNHWMVPCLSVLYILQALASALVGKDDFSRKDMVMIWAFLSAILIVLWSTTYTTLSNGILSKHFLFWKRKIPTTEIKTIAPHKKNGAWGYGVVMEICLFEGKKITLQPNDPKPFLAMLHDQAPQADYLF